MQMRVPYKKLIKEFADNFFSSAVRCKMNERIETLDRNDEEEKEKDVFKVQVSFNQKKEAAKKEKKKSDEAAAVDAAAVTTATAAG